MDAKPEAKATSKGKGPKRLVEKDRRGTRRTWLVVGGLIVACGGFALLNSPGHAIEVGGGRVAVAADVGAVVGQADGFREQGQGFGQGQGLAGWDRQQCLAQGTHLVAQRAQEGFGVGMGLGEQGGRQGQGLAHLSPLPGQVQGGETGRQGVVQLAGQLFTLFILGRDEALAGQFALAQAAQALLGVLALGVAVAPQQQHAQRGQLQGQAPGQGVGFHQIPDGPQSRIVEQQPGGAEKEKYVSQGVKPGQAPLRRPAPPPHGSQPECPGQQQHP